MRIEDLTNYLQLRRLCDNPLEVLRYRKRQHGPAPLVVRLRGRPPLHLRGGHFDFHAFHRIWLRDEYRLDPLLRGPLDTVIDLGGNVGTFAARVATRARRVIVCEPIAENVARLHLNLDPLDNVTIVPRAVADRPGTLSFHVPKEDHLSGCWSSYQETADNFGDATEEVEATTLPDVFTEHGIDRVDLLKMDIEGAEYDVLRHTAEQGLLARCARIHGEYHDVRPEDPRTRLATFRAWLAEQGFEVDVHEHPKRPNHGLFFARRRA